jgi:hypothetical protein
LLQPIRPRQMEPARRAVAWLLMNDTLNSS